MMKNILLTILQLCIFYSYGLTQSTITIKGKVTSNGEPVIGATVQIKGTTIGTITDAEGNYTLTNISKGNITILVRSVGYKEQEQSVTVDASGMATLNIVMEFSSLDLEAIVVTGLSVNLKEKEQGISRANVSAETLNNFRRLQWKMHWLEDWQE